MKRFRFYLKLAAGLAVVLVLLLGVLAINAIWFRPWSPRVFFKREFLRDALDDPELLTNLGLLEPFGMRAHNARLTDASPAHTRRLIALRRASLATLGGYDTNSSASARITGK